MQINFSIYPILKTPIFIPAIGKEYDKKRSTMSDVKYEKTINI